jgi:hypothetical protein
LSTRYIYHNDIILVASRPMLVNDIIIVWENSYIRKEPAVSPSTTTMIAGEAIILPRNVALGDYAATMGGFRRWKSVAFSNIPAICSNRASPKWGAMSWWPTGSPDSVKPHGMLIAGIPAKLAAQL